MNKLTKATAVPCESMMQLSNQLYTIPMEIAKRNLQVDRIGRRKTYSRKYVKNTIERFSLSIMDFVIHNWGQENF